MVNQAYGFSNGNALSTFEMLESFIRQSGRIINDIDREIEALSTAEMIMDMEDLAFMDFYANEVPKMLPTVRGGNRMMGNYKEQILLEL